MSNVNWIPKEYKRLAVINDFNVYSDDARTLAKGQWLNDNIITFIMEMAFTELDVTRQEDVGCNDYKCTIRTTYTRRYILDLLSTCFYV